MQHAQPIQIQITDYPKTQNAIQMPNNANKANQIPTMKSL
jgi:hypothetical protein